MQYQVSPDDPPGSHQLLPTIFWQAGSAVIHWKSPVQTYRQQLSVRHDTRRKYTDTQYGGVNGPRNRGAKKSTHLGSALNRLFN